MRRCVTAQHSQTAYGVSWCCSIRQRVVLHFLGKFRTFSNRMFGRCICRCGRSNTTDLGVWTRSCAFITSQKSILCVWVAVTKARWSKLSLVMLLSACFYNCNICCFSDIFARVYERYHLLRILIWMRTVGGRTPTLRIQISTLQFTELLFCKPSWTIFSWTYNQFMSHVYLISGWYYSTVFTILVNYFRSLWCKITIKSAFGKDVIAVVLLFLHINKCKNFRQWTLVIWPVLQVV